MASGKIQMTKINPDLKNQLKTLANEKQTTMTELIKYQLRKLLKENNLPTI
jgi:antitoxin component of RelBE/YafQ-DinJ toxin-antitoxin module